MKRSLYVFLGEYSTWFATQDSVLLLQIVAYVSTTLGEPALSLVAATALKQLCDANRTQLAPHIASFGDILAFAGNIPVRVLHHPRILTDNVMVVW